MSKITASTDLDRVPKEKFNKYLVEFLENTVQVVNGQVEFTSNIKGEINQVSFPVADTNVTVTHSLKRDPVGYLVFSVSAAMIIYESSKSLNNIVLKSSAIGSATVFIF